MAVNIPKIATKRICCQLGESTLSIWWYFIWDKGFPRLKWDKKGEKSQQNLQITSFLTTVKENSQQYKQWESGKDIKHPID